MCIFLLLAGLFFRSATPAGNHFDSIVVQQGSDTGN